MVRSGAARAYIAFSHFIEVVKRCESIMWLARAGRGTERCGVARLGRARAY